MRVWMVSLLSTLLAVLLAAACTAPTSSEVSLTVAEVWAKATQLEGQRLRVRGEAWFEHAQTARLCVPARCDCNQSTATWRC